MTPHVPHLPAPTPRSLAKVLLRMLPLAMLVGGVTAASAASLGISPASFGSASVAITSCDTSFDVSYTTAYDELSGNYQVTHAVVSDIDISACATQTLDVMVAGDGYVELATATASVDAPTMSLELSTPVNADAVRNIAVMISG
jgi:hypothetical protein